jgi:hypothetical protein
MIESIQSYQPEDFDRLLFASRGIAVESLEKIAKDSGDERNALRAATIIFRVDCPMSAPEGMTLEAFEAYLDILNRARYAALVRAGELSSTSADEVIRERASHAILRLQTTIERQRRFNEKQAKAKRAATKADGAKKIAAMSKRLDISFNEAVQDYISLQIPGQRALYAKKLGQKFGDSFARKVVTRSKEIISSQTGENA